MGTTGLETAFAALYSELVLPGVLSLTTLVERLTAGAGVLDLPVPAIKEGAPANLVLVDLAASWIAGEAGYESRSDNCCFAGRDAARPRAAHRGRRRGRLPGARLRATAHAERRHEAGPARPRAGAALVVVDVQEAFRRPSTALTRSLAHARSWSRGARAPGLCR